VNAAQPRPAISLWLALVVLCLGLSMPLLDVTIVNIAIPSIIDGLHASLDQLLWVINAYSLVFTVLLITSGRLGNVLGPRNLFVAGVLLFASASAWCGLAHNGTQLILARGVQGLGAALLAPQPLAFVTSLFPPERRGAASGVLGAVGGAALVAGPTLGGFLVTRFGWPWIFLINVPLGAVTVVLTLAVVPNLRPARGHRLDLLGVLLATAGLFGIVFGLIEGQRYDWGTVWAFVTIPEIIAAGVLTLLVFLEVQRRRQRAEPLLPFVVFRNRSFTLTLVVVGGMGFAILGVFLPLTIYFQLVLGLSALDTGLTLAPMVVTMAIVGLVSGQVADRIGGRYLLIAGLLLYLIGTGYIDWNAHPDSGRWTLLPGLLIDGVAIGCVWVTTYATAMRNVKPELGGAASGVLNTIQELAGVLAAATVGAVLQNRLAAALHDQAVRSAEQLPPALRGRFVDAFSGAATNNLDVSRVQTGGGINLPPGTSAQLAHLLQQLSHDVFTRAYVDSMQVTLLLPMGLVLLAAFSPLGLTQERGIRRQKKVEPGEPAPSQDRA
jgi:EmrB/QacA subfamily drug resistance transporter